MTTTPDPKTVREIARDCVADYIDDARDIAAHVMGHFGMGVPGDVYAWTDAVRTDLRAVVPSWPDEQPQDERDARIAQLERELRSLRGTELNSSPLVLDAQAYSELRDEIAATMGDGWDLDEAEISILIKYVRWLAAGQPRDEDGYPIRRETYPAAAAQNEQDVERLPSITADINDAEAEVSGTFDMTIEEVRALLAERARQDGDVRAVERARDLIEALWNGDAVTADAEHVLAELDARFGPAIAALDARDAKGGEPR